MLREHIDKSEELTIVARQSFKEREYWLKKLSGELLKSSFPRYIDSPGKDGDLETRMKKLEFELPIELASKILKLSNKSDRRLYLTLISGLFTLLEKYTGNRDIIIGMPVEKQEIEGDFINTILAVRNYWEEDVSFKELLLGTRKVVLEAIENQNYPIEILLYDLGLESGGKEFPLFDIAVLLEDLHEKKFITQFGLDMIFVFNKRDDRIEGAVEYNSLFYENTYVNRILRHFITLLEKALSNVDVPVKNICILSGEEKNQLLYEFNKGTPGDSGSKGKTIRELFEAVVQKDGDRIALINEGTQLSYGELDKKANRFALVLKGKGVKTETIVGMMVERSIEMIVGMLGILKAGGAYLPIDPGYPGKRIDYILKDSGTTLLVTDTTYVENVNFKGEWLRVDIEGDDPGDIPGIVGSYYPGNSAYIIYTSGSTGNPKGVVVEHRSIVNTLCWRKNHYKFNEKDTVLQIPSYTFDSSVEDIFTPLISGSKIVILRTENPFEMQYISRTIIRLLVTHFLIVPNLYKAFLSEIRDSLGCMRKITLAGEGFTEELVAEHFEKLNSVKLYNEYGPTENSVCSTVYEFTPGRTRVLIGRPINNVNCYILDRNLELVPVGVPGQLYLSGDGLARGYLGRPGLTSEKFMENPFEAGKKIYETGDSARWTQDGDIEFLGRIDHQVKIRGFRIELGEIENRLMKYEGVEGAVVSVREDERGDKYLCAYLVLNRELDFSEIREYLSKELPAYMIPLYYVNLEQIPVNSHGKIDRKALPEPTDIVIKDDVPYVPPRDAVEKLIAEAWEKVLGRENISVNENFFMLGGDSIKSIQIISRINNSGYKLEMKDLFQYPVISELALRIKKASRISNQAPVSGTVPLGPIQEWFFHNHKIDIHHFNQAVMLYSKDGFDEAAANAIFTKIQEHHDALRMTYKFENGKIIQINQGVDYSFSLDVCDLRNREGGLEALEARVCKIQSSIDLEKGPMMKLGLFHLDDGDRLLIAIHHLVVDGVSWRILFEDIETLHQQYKKGEPLTLPLKTDSFKVWTGKLSDYADSETFLKEKEYWVKLNSVNVPSIEKDFEEEGNYRKDAETLSFRLGEKETGDLLTKVNEAFGTEINDILLTALGRGITKTWGHNHVLISLEGHGREEIMEGIDINRTIGWFTSGYPLVLDMSRENDPGRLVKEVKEAVRKSPNKGIGYDILKYLTGKEHKEDIDFNLNPQFGFNYLGQFDAEIGQMSFEIAEESVGDVMSIEGERDFDFEITGMIANNRLGISINYNTKHFKTETVDLLVNHIQGELENIIAFCRSKEKLERTPSDFTYKGLSIETIDRLVKEYPGLEDIYTLTPMQEGMAYHAVFDREAYSYFNQTSFRLQGELDISLVEKSFNELLKRHDILRTSFVYQDIERIVQVVSKERTIDFYYEDISNIGGWDEKESFTREFKKKDKDRSFDLSKDALMRVSIFRLDNLEHEVTWSFHHIVMDGWCVGIINFEFFEIYNSYIEKRPYKLPPINSYRTYIQWLEKQDKASSDRYWRNYLGSFEEQTGVPKTKRTGKMESESPYKNERVSIVLDREKTALLNRLAAGNQVTLNVLIQAIWGIQLGKYNGKNDVVFGTVVSGRPTELEGVETMVGLFINTVPVRIRYEEKMKFPRLLQQVQEEALAGEHYHYYPLADIQANTTLKQDLIDHLFVFENYPVGEQIEGDRNESKGNRLLLKVETLDIFEQSNYDLNILLAKSEQLTITFEYNGNVYDRDLLNRIGTHLMEIVDQVLENEEITIEEIGILTEEEKNRILNDFQNTYVEYPKESIFQQKPAGQTPSTPDKEEDTVESHEFSNDFGFK